MGHHAAQLGPFSGGALPNEPGGWPPNGREFVPRGGVTLPDNVELGADAPQGTAVTLLPVTQPRRRRTAPSSRPRPGAGSLGFAVSGRGLLFAA
jgi:hypothetical protein